MPWKVSPKICRSPVNTSNCFVCYSSVYTFCINNSNHLTIVWQFFVTEMFKPRLISSNIPRLHTRLTKFLLTQLLAFSCLFYGNVNSLMNDLVVEGSWHCLLEIPINVNIVVYNYYCSDAGSFFEKFLKKSVVRSRL